MRSIAILFMAIVTLLAGPASAQVLSIETWVEEWDPAARTWVRVAEPAAGAERYVAPAPVPKPQPGVAQYGPFRVLDGSRAALVDATDSASPAHFAAMLRNHPGLSVLEMIECPGTDDDLANLRVGRMIRAAGLATRVPRGGSVRSGAVELFLAGKTRMIEDGAEFAVHSWIDEYGREPDDYAAEDPANRSYVTYYREMGMTAETARAFYDMTNSVPHHQARWLTAQDMRRWLGEDAARQGVAIGVTEPAKPDVALVTGPQLAYLDLNAAFN